MSRDLLKSKFRTLPKWANERLDSANSAQLRRWLKNFVGAKTLEEVLGKK